MSNDEATECVWPPSAEVASLRRSPIVDIGFVLAQTTPPTGHVAPVPDAGLIQY